MEETTYKIVAACITAIIGGGLTYLRHIHVPDDPDAGMYIAGWTLVIVGMILVP